MSDNAKKVFIIYVTLLIKKYYLIINLILCVSVRVYLNNYDKSCNLLQCFINTMEVFESIFF